MVVFHKMPYFLQNFSKNWVKTLVHSTLHKKMLISRRSTSFGGFSANALLFATFCLKLGQNPSARYFAPKVAYFEEIDKFRWFFTKCHTFCNVLLKVVSNPSARYFAQKGAYFEEIEKFRWFFTKCHTFCNILLKIGSKP